MLRLLRGVCVCVQCTEMAREVGGSPVLVRRGRKIFYSNNKNKHAQLNHQITPVWFRFYYYLLPMAHTAVQILFVQKHLVGFGDGLLERHVRNLHV